MSTIALLSARRRFLLSALAFTLSLGFLLCLGWHLETMRALALAAPAPTAGGWRSQHFFVHAGLSLVLSAVLAGLVWLLLAQSAQRRLLEYRLTAHCLNGSSEGFLITDAQQRIVQINPAFSAITGYSAAEALGQTPRLLASGRHDSAFYRAMWHELEHAGRWVGEVWNQRRNGEVYPQWLSINRILDERGQCSHYVGIFSDLSQGREQEARLQRLAYYDPLTGLPNRSLLRERVEHDLRLEQAHGAALSLLLIDLDDFKNINDTFGHACGDTLLVEVARRIQAQARDPETLARAGGDEFVLVLPETDANAAAERAAALLGALSQPYRVAGQDLTVTPSIGIALYPSDGTDFEALLRCADSAMYRAKQEGRSRHAFFAPALQAQAARRLQLSNALRRAIERDELSLHYQPQVALADKRLVGVEALLRWHHPELGAVSPAEFIPVAESSGLIEAIGDWVLQRACAQAQQWRLQGRTPPLLAVNVSALQLRQSGLAARVAQVLAETGWDAQLLELELTESAAMQDPAAAQRSMEALHQLGVQWAVDDFGTGYSSFSQLKGLRLGKLKIDRSFVRGLPAADDDLAIVRTIVQMARGLKLVTVAEGVETEAQRACLEQLGCDQIQGYLLARPLPPQDFAAAWLERRGASSPPPQPAPP